MMNKLRTMLVIAVVGLGATALFAHDRAVLLPQPGNQAASAEAWSATSLDAPSAGLTDAGLSTPVRRVVVSGYHPLEGFEAETAAEQSALANSSAGAPPKAVPIR